MLKNRAVLRTLPSEGNEIKSMHLRMRFKFSGNDVDHPVGCIFNTFKDGDDAISLENTILGEIYGSVLKGAVRPR